MNHRYRTDISYVFNDLYILLELLTHIFVTEYRHKHAPFKHTKVLFDAHVNNVKFKCEVWEERPLLGIRYFYGELMCFAQKHNKAQVVFAPKTLYHLATFTDVEKLLVNYQSWKLQIRS